MTRVDAVVVTAKGQKAKVARARGPRRKRSLRPDAHQTLTECICRTRIHILRRMATRTMLHMATITVGMITADTHTDVTATTTMTSTPRTGAMARTI